MKSSLMLGVNPNAIREENDFYATNPKALDIALPLLKEVGLNTRVWECSCGQGHLSEVLIRNGYEVKSSDLIDRGYGEVLDFLKCECKFDGDILTNPPFKLASEFVKKGFELIQDGNKIFLFLKIQFLESKSRKVLFENYPLKHLIVYSERQQCAKDADFENLKATTQCYAWYVFEKGFEGKTTIDWI